MLEIIGKEVLPNLYIKDVIVSSGRISLVVSFFDYIDASNSISTFAPDFVYRQNINLNLILCKDGSEIDATLKSTSEYSMYSLKANMIKSDNLSDNDDEVYQETTLNSLYSKIQAAVQSSEPGQLMEITHEFSFSSYDFYEFENLTCYAFFSYDISKEEDALFLDVELPSNSRCLNGPIVSENIISNNNIHTTTSRFTIDGVEYPGPVHFHDSNFMEGSLHTDQPHRTVQRENVKNPKIFVMQYNDLFSTIGNPQPTEQTFFSAPILSVGNKFVFGFFSFNVEKYFASQRQYKYFINSSITLNLYKIKDNIRLLVGGTPVVITEILVNHEDSNEMFFYFKIPFSEYVSTNFKFKFQVFQANNIFKPTLLKIHQKFYADIYAVRAAYNLADQQNLEYVSITSGVLMLRFIKAYVGLFSMIKELTALELQKLKEIAIGSLYNSIVPISVLRNYIAQCDNFMTVLMTEVNSSTNNSASLYSEPKTDTVGLRRYKNSLTYLGGRELVHPDNISDSLIKVNTALTQLSGFFENAEQILLPSFVRNDFGVLKEIDYADLFSNIPLINVLQPDDTLEEIDEEDP